jgi:acetyl-CoA carboxylase carboxyltransferase component
VHAPARAARFVDFCNSFGVPLLAIVDTPGFMPGSKQERAGVIRHGASLYAQEHLRAHTAAAAGFVDEIIEPAQTRERLVWALRTLAGGRA